MTKTKTPKDPEAEKAKLERRVQKMRARLEKELLLASHGREARLLDQGRVLLRALDPLVMLLAIGGKGRYGGTELSIVGSGPNLHFHLTDTEAKHIASSYIRLILGPQGVGFELFAKSSSYPFDSETVQSAVTFVDTFRNASMPMVMQAASVYGADTVIRDPSLLSTLLVAAAQMATNKDPVDDVPRVAVNGVHVGVVSEDGWRPITDLEEAAPRPRRKKKTKVS